jgi:NADH-quinone oxidoreductase subunit C
MTGAQLRRTTVPLSAWRATLSQARDEGLLVFDWLAAVDQTDDPDDPGFDVVCHVMRPPGPGGPLLRLLAQTRAPQGQAVPSLTGIWPGAAWHEREAHEMFGVDFEGFQDASGLGLRPLLLPAGFAGAPLRKDFPLAARTQRPWPGAVDPAGARGRAPVPPGVADQRRGGPT